MTRRGAEHHQDGQRGSASALPSLCRPYSPSLALDAAETYKGFQIKRDASDRAWGVRFVVSKNGSMVAEYDSAEIAKKAIDGFLETGRWARY